MSKESKLQRLQRLNLTHLIACGRHSNRYCENDGVWDLSCRFCSELMDVIIRVLDQPDTPRCPKCGNGDLDIRTADAINSDEFDSRTVTETQAECYSATCGYRGPWKEFTGPSQAKEKNESRS